MRKDYKQYNSLLSLLLIIFVVAVIFNYVWEMAQSIFYVGMKSFNALWHCFIASLGDGLLVLLIFATGWVVLRRRAWFMQPGTSGYILMLITGLVIGISIEWLAVHVIMLWKYTAQMPLVPGLNIGVLPVAQMLMLPPLIFGAVSKRQSRAKRQ